MSLKNKILLCGDVEGRFDTLFNRVRSINSKSGPFDLLLCVGNFFGVNNTQFGPYKLGEKKVPVPTYILGPTKEDHVNEYPEDESQFELCPNVYYLGKRGIYNDSKGLKIVYISGVAGTTNNKWTYNETDILELCEAAIKGNPTFRGVDILICAQWPSGIIHDSTKVKITVNFPSELLGYLCMKLKPRYVVSGLEGVYYERPPFRCPNLGDHDTTMESVTRFIGLARVGNPNKDKWIYALNVTPLDKMKISELIQRTTDETVCPFNFYELEQRVLKTKKPKPQSGNQYFYDMSAPMQDPPKRKPKRARVEFDQSKCWFCLASSPDVEKHLVISVGEFCYLALAKGGMVDEHFLICPIEHVQSSLVATDSIRDEIISYQKKVRSFYKRKRHYPVFFERNYKTSHMQVQCVPVPNKFEESFVKDIFMEMSTDRGFPLKTLNGDDPLDQVIPSNTPYFLVQISTGEKLYTKIEGSMNFPLNFGREVLASKDLLDMPDRVEYKDCLSGKTEEEKIVAQIRSEMES